MSVKKGNIPWNKGKKGLQSAWNKGMKFPEFSGAGSPAWKSKIKKICPQCKKEFEVCPSRKRLKFCSQICYWKTLKEKTSWMKGKKHSKEACLKIKDKRKKQISWNKNKKFTQISGNKHWNWKGGTSPLYEAIRSLFEYKNWRKEIFERDNYACKECSKRGGKELHSHHIKSFASILKEFLQQYNQFSPIEDKETLVRLAITYKQFWDIENGKTLCEKCHKKTSNYFVRR